MVLNSYTYTDRELEELCTQVFKTTMGFVLEQKLVDEATAVSIMGSHAVILRDANFFKRFWAKLTKQEEKEAKDRGNRLYIVKIAEAQEEKEDG
ncbi:MAG: hypothetical protein DRI65_11360 [Chloroflexota bacterium]|nr:MAG: hypothetical protein DRI65_11360 [Chloroflexota bacterium]